MGRVVVLGASLIDMNLRLPSLPTAGETRLGTNFFTSTGGKGANQAVAARRAGADVVFLSAFGDDDFGRQMRDRYFAEGIDLRHVKQVEGEPSGVALIMVGDDGENLIGVSMGANSRLSTEYIDGLPSEVFDPSDVFLASLEVPFATVARAIFRANEAGMTVILNPAPASRDVVLSGLLSKVDILIPNESEAAILTGLDSSTEISILADALERLGSKQVVLTLGERGNLSIFPGGRISVAAFRVEVVDTVGAGDAFNGVFAATIAEGVPGEASIRANGAGAIAVTRPGAQGALPSRAEIDRMVQSVF